MTKHKQSNGQLLNVNLRVFVMAGLAFLLFYPPFLRGLFFAPELLMTHMFTAVVFALCWYDKILRRDVSFVKGNLDYTVLALVAVYVLSLFGAVNMRGAVGELLKVINYFMVYWITAQTVKSERDIKILYRAVFFSAVGVAVVGIGAAAGLVDYPGAIWENRLCSTLQYPNTTATFLALATFLGFTLLNTSQTRVGKITYMTGNTLLMAVIVGSQSRGSWFLYPLVLFLFFLGLSGIYRFSTFYNLVVSLGVGLQLAKIIQKSISQKVDLSLFTYVFIGAVAVSLAQWGYDMVITWLDRSEALPRTRKLLAAGVVLYSIMVLLFYVGYSVSAVPSIAAKFVPTSALKRADTINNQAAGFKTRVDFTKTAFKMAMDYPLNGLGGEGWNSLYHRYQPYLYYSSETHNYPAKVLVETGFIGLLALVAVWGLWGNCLFRLSRKELEDDSWSLIWAGGVAALTLGIHSMYDFDLSMGAISIVLWALMGITRGYEESLSTVNLEARHGSRKLVIGFVGGTIGAALLFLPAASFYSAGLNGAEAAEAMTNRNWVLAETKLIKAVRLDPFTASYSADLAQVYTIKGMASNDSSQIALAEIYSNQAVKVEPYNYQVRLRLLMVSLLSGRVDEAVKDAESLVENNPLDVHDFEILGKVYILSGRYMQDAGQKKKALQYWNGVGNLRKMLDVKVKELENTPEAQGEPLQVTSIIKLFEGEAAFLFGDYKRAHNLLTEINIQKIPRLLQMERALYLNAAEYKIGNKLLAENEISALVKQYPNLSGEFRNLLKAAP